MRPLWKGHSNPQRGCTPHVENTGMVISPSVSDLHKSPEVELGGGGAHL